MLLAVLLTWAALEGRAGQVEVATARAGKVAALDTDRSSLHQDPLQGCTLQQQVGVHTSLYCCWRWHGARQPPPGGVSVSKL